jgi:hypothetical protein
MPRGAADGRRTLLHRSGPDRREPSGRATKPFRPERARPRHREGTEWKAIGGVSGALKWRPRAGRWGVVTRLSGRLRALPEQLLDRCVTGAQREVVGADRVRSRGRRHAPFFGTPAVRVRSRPLLEWSPITPASGSTSPLQHPLFHQIYRDFQLRLLRVWVLEVRRNPATQRNLPAANGDPAEFATPAAASPFAASHCRSRSFVAALSAGSRARRHRPEKMILRPKAHPSPDSRESAGEMATTPALSRWSRKRASLPL